MKIIRMVRYRTKMICDTWFDVMEFKTCFYRSDPFRSLRRAKYGYARHR